MSVGSVQVVGHDIVVKGNLSARARNHYLGPINLTGSGTVTVPMVGFTINGVSLPDLSWAWVAGALASSVLSEVGGIVFELLKLAFGIGGGPNIEQLLRDQLVQIERIVKDAIKSNEIRACQAALDGVVDAMRSYNNNPHIIKRLEDADSESRRLVANLGSLGYAAYTTYLAAASLRMVVLQEYAIKDGQEIDTLKNVLDTSIKYHNDWKAIVDTTTRPSYQVDRWYERHSALSPRGFFGRMRFPYLTPQEQRIQARVEEDICGVISPKNLPRMDVDSQEAKIIIRDLNSYYSTMSLTQRGFSRINGLITVKEWIAAEQPNPLIVKWDVVEKSLYDMGVGYGRAIASVWATERAKLA